MKLPLLVAAVCLVGCSGGTFTQVDVFIPGADASFGARDPAPDAALPPSEDSGWTAVDASAPLDAAGDAPDVLDAGPDVVDAALDASDAAPSCIPVNPNWTALYCPGDVGWNCPPNDAGVQPLPPVSGCAHTPAALYVWCCAPSDAGDGGGQ